MPQTTQDLWELVIRDNPECTETEIGIQQGDLSNQDYFDLLEKFQCGKKYQQAKLELERVESERKDKCDNVIAQFRKKLQDNNLVYNYHIRIFFDEVLMTVLGVMPGYNDVNAPFPDNEIIAPLRQLDKYELGWKASDEIARARVLWKENRPCVTQDWVLTPKLINTAKKRPVAKKSTKVEAQPATTGGERKGKLKRKLGVFFLYIVIFFLFAMGGRCFYCAFDSHYCGGIGRCPIGFFIITIFGSLVLFALGCFSIRVAMSLRHDIPLSTFSKIIQSFVTPIVLIIIGVLIHDTHSNVLSYGGNEESLREETALFLNIGVFSTVVGSLHYLYHIGRFIKYIYSKMILDR